MLCSAENIDWENLIHKKTSKMYTVLKVFQNEDFLYNHDTRVEEFGNAVHVLQSLIEYINKIPHKIVTSSWILDNMTTADGTLSMYDVTRTAEYVNM